MDKLNNWFIDGLSKVLTDVLSKSKEELYDFGIKSKQWVISKKNNILQAARIINWIGDLT